MCQGCYQELGSPVDVTPDVMVALQLIKAVYSMNAVGGNLHCQLDDWNLQDSMFEERYAANLNFVELACFNKMKELTVNQRATALAMYDEYIPVTQPVLQ